jgi:hypothetical protein
MAITETNLPGNGTAGPFTYTFPALEAGDIYVSVDGVVKTVTTDYSLNFVDKQITFLTTPYPTVSNVIRIYRVTDDADLAATFYSGAAIRATDLNTNFTQGLYVTQESNREAATAISTAGSAVTTANAATATANSAVSTANAATATANTALSNSSAAVSTANTASSNASAAVSTANTASSNASAAVSTANTASSNATAAVNTANAATATANSAASDAATAISTANGAVTTANNAAADAATAISTANTASSNASAAVSTANTASSNATSAVNTANSALSTANAAASAVANAILYDIVANVAAIPASPANNDAVEVIDSTGIESFTPLTSIPGGFAGNSGLSVRIVYTTTGNTWTWIQYFPNDPETRYLKEAVTTSDTAPVSPSDGDLWYDSVGGRTYVYYDDGAGSQWVDTSPQGSGVSDAISEGDTSAEVIDTGSDGRFVVTTEGSERLRIDSSGRVGIGTTSVSETLHLKASAPRIRIEDAEGGYSNIEGDGGSLGIYADNGNTQANSFIRFDIDGTEKSRLTSSGQWLVGTSTARSNIARYGADYTPATQIQTNVTSGWGTGLSLVNYSASGYAPVLTFGLSGSNTAGTNTLVASGDRMGVITFNGNDGANFEEGARIEAQVDGTPSANDMPGRLVFSTTADGASAPTERLRINSAGFVGIGTSSPAHYLHVSASVNDAVTNIVNTDTTNGYGLSVVAGGSASNRYIARFADAGNNAKAIILANGNVGIGTTSPRRTLEVSGADGYLCLNATNTSTGTSQLLFGDTDDDNIGRIYYDHTDNNMAFWTDTSEKARIDSSGRLLVGTSTGDSNTRLHVSASENTSDPMATDASITIANTVNVGNNEAAALKFNLGNTNTASISAHYDAFSAGVNSSLRFYTQFQSSFNAPTERMRISQNGAVAVRSTGNYPFVSNSSSAPGTTATLFAGNCNATDLVGTGATTVFIVYNNGNVQNTNNSYAGISDIKLKENIVDATSQWNDLKSLQVRNYNFKEGQTHTQIGLVAQEAELVSPGLVSESPDRDEDGNDLGTVTKSVNYSVLYMKAVKALQEAMTRIETLEAANTDLAARLTALEGGTN